VTVFNKTLKKTTQAVVVHEELYGNIDLQPGATDRPLVTFAVFAYNQERFIRQAVEGAFAQTYSPLEIVLTDDCSSDQTFELMRKLASEYKGPHRIVVRRNITNQGVLRHVLDIFHVAKGKYVVCAAGDDISFPDRVDVLVSVFSRTPADVVALDSDSLALSDDGRIGGVSFKRRQSTIHGATAAYDRQFFLDLPYPVEKVMLEDRVFSWVIASRKKRYLHINKPLILYRQSESSIANFGKNGDYVAKLRRQCALGVQAARYILYCFDRPTGIPRLYSLSLRLELSALQNLSDSSHSILLWRTVLYAFARARWAIPIILYSGSSWQILIAKLVNAVRRLAGAGALRLW